MLGVKQRRQFVAADHLRTFRCRVRAFDRTTTVDCLAPTAASAAYAVGKQALESDGARWIQVVVSEWIAAMGEFVEPENAIMISLDDLAPAGADRVVFGSVATPVEG